MIDIDKIRSAPTMIAEYFISFPYAKSVYVIILLFLIAVLTREVYTVLLDRTVYIGNFDYFADGKATPESAKSFSAYIAGQHRLLRTALIQENRERREREKPSSSGFEIKRGLPAALPELSTWVPLLSDTELKIQGFDLGKLLTVLRTWAAPPLEITGFVEKSGTGTRVLVAWPQSDPKANDTGLVEAYDTGVLNNDSSAAFAVAASIVWADAAATDKTFRQIPRTVFVHWALAWWDLRALRSRAARGQEFSPDDVSRWKQARALVETLIPNAEQYAEIWRLRADVIEIAPLKIGENGVYSDTTTQTADKKIALEDRQKYEKASTINLIAVVQSILKLVPGMVLPLGLPAPDLPLKFVNDITVRPGRTIWVHRKSSTDSTADVAVTATAIVVGADNKKKLLLPDYALPEGTDDIEFEFKLNPSGSAIGRASKSDLVFQKDRTPKIGEGVLLVPIEDSPATSNEINNRSANIVLRQVSSATEPGTTLTLVTSSVMLETKLSMVSENGFIVAPRVTAPGVGGAPVIDSEQKLIAMAYSGTGKESQFMPLNWLFQQEKLTLP